MGEDTEGFVAGAEAERCCEDGESVVGTLVCFGYPTGGFGEFCFSKELVVRGLFD